MAFRRRRKFRRRFKRRTMRRRKANYGPPRRRLALMPHLYRRTCCVTTANVTTGVAGGAGVAVSQTSDGWVLDTGAAPGVNVSWFSFALEYTLDMLPSYLEFTNLYDQYKINRVALKIIPFATTCPVQTGLAGATNQSLSVIMHQVNDYDDSTAFAAGSAGVDLMRQYVTYKSRNFFNSTGRPIKRYIKPRIATAAYGGGVFGSYANTAPKWIDSASPSVQHYGNKFILEVFQPDTTQRIFIWFKMEATLYLECRQPR